MLRAALCASLAALALMAPGGPAATAAEDRHGGSRALVIGHRGAAGYLPEHTLASYALAIAQGADYIEPDLVLTKDGVFIARHENDLGDTTDVRGKFPLRRSRKVIDGRPKEGWFSEDFTLAEIRTLRARERLPFRDHSHDGRYPVPTLEEILALVQRKRRELERPVGIIPELKHPSYFASIGLPMAERLADILRAHGYDDATAPVFIQSFETAILKQLQGLIRARRVQLIGRPTGQPYDLAAAGEQTTYADLATPQGLREIAGYAHAIGPHKRYILPVARDGTRQAPTTLVADAHRAGLLVFAYTFRNEARYLAPGYRGDPQAEYRAIFEQRVDGVFSDFPDVAVKARQSLAAE